MIDAIAPKTTLNVALAEGIATITLAAPGAGHAVSCVTNLQRALTQAALIPDVTAVIVTGEGTIFSSCPVDCAACSDLSDEMKTQHQFRELAWTIVEFPLPLLMALNGAASGFGALIALMGDHTVMSTRATLVHPLRGTDSYWSSDVSRFLTNVIGYSRALEAQLLGVTISARLAESWGLVTDVVPPEALGSRSRERAATMAASPYQRRGWRARLVGCGPSSP